MKRAVVLAVIAAAGLLIPVAASAQVVDRETSPVSFTLTNPCNGDLVSFVGEEKVFFMTGNPDFGFHLQLHMTGTATSGATYVVAGHNTTITHYSNRSLQEVGVMVQGIAYHTGGPGNNLAFRALFHLTISPSGEVVSQVIRATTECR